MEMENFFKEYEDIFEEYLENTIENLKYNNEKYKELYEKYNNILKENKNIGWVLDGNSNDKTLNNTECKALGELEYIYMCMREIEDKAIFFAGGKEVYYYLKNMGILK